MGEISEEHLRSPETALTFRAVSVDCKVQKVNWELHTGILYSRNYKISRKATVIQ